MTWCYRTGDHIVVPEKRVKMSCYRTCTGSWLCPREQTESHGAVLENRESRRRGTERTESHGAVLENRDSRRRGTEQTESHGAALEEEEELANLAERLHKASTAYGMEISAEKTKLMTNNTSGINTEIKVNGQKLETITCLKVPELSYN